MAGFPDYLRFIMGWWSSTTGTLPPEPLPPKIFAPPRATLSGPSRQIMYGPEREIIYAPPDP